MKLALRFALLPACLWLANCAAAPLALNDTTSGPHIAAKSAQTGDVTQRYSAGMVSSADPRATEAGLQILRKGGSATDASIAVMLALSVVEPQSSGIGGGGFYLRSDGAGNVSTIDGRETAPAAATPQRFLKPDGSTLAYTEAVISGLSVGVPSNIALAARAHQEHGSLAWAELFAPAIALARDGFALTPRLVSALRTAKNRAAYSKEGLALFYGADGAPLPVGTVVKNPALARTLTAIAEQGSSAFYQGALAQEIATTTAAATPHDGTMMLADVNNYKAKDRPAVCGAYRQYRICGMGPPSSGATTVFTVLKQLERFDLTALGKDSPVAWHLFAESQRLAYADRDRYLADSDYLSVPLQGLMDEGYIGQRSALLSANSRMGSVSAGAPFGAELAQATAPAQPESGTSHIAVIDRQGNAVSYTSTVEGPFGSGLMVGGFYLNNELTDFTFQPLLNGQPVANRVEGGKRPRSSMAPTLVFDREGRLVLALGAAGGATIPMQVAKALIGVLDWNLTAQEALALPGLFSPYGQIALEPDSPLRAMAAQWEAMGHTVTERAMPFKANALQVLHTAQGPVLQGAADPRSEGVALSE